MTTASVTVALCAPTLASRSRRALTADECRAWLNTHSEGRLSYLSGRASRLVVVPYALTREPTDDTAIAS